MYDFNLCKFINIFLMVKYAAYLEECSMAFDKNVYSAVVSELFFFMSVRCSWSVVFPHPLAPY